MYTIPRDFKYKVATLSHLVLYFQSLIKDSAYSKEKNAIRNRNKSLQRF